MVALDRVEGVDAVEDVDLVPPAAQGPREPVDVGRVAAEAVGAEERGDHAELQRRPPVPSASMRIARRRLPVRGESVPGRGRDPALLPDRPPVAPVDLAGRRGELRRIPRARRSLTGDSKRDNRQTRRPILAVERAHSLQFSIGKLMLLVAVCGLNIFLPEQDRSRPGRVRGPPVVRRVAPAWRAADGGSSWPSRGPREASRAGSTDDFLKAGSLALGLFLGDGGELPVSIPDGLARRGADRHPARDGVSPHRHCPGHPGRSRSSGGSSRGRRLLAGRLGRLASRADSRPADPRDETLAPG